MPLYNPVVSSGGAGELNSPGYKSGLNLWYTPINIKGALGGGSPGTVALTAYCVLCEIGGNANVTINSLGCRINTNGGNVQLAIYNNDATSGIWRPGTLIDSTGNISVSSGAPTGVTGALSGGSHSLAPGFYWIALQSDTASTFSYYAVAAQSNSNIAFVGTTNALDALGSPAPDSVSFTTGITSYGVWPTGIGATYSTGFGRAPYVAFKVP